MFLEKNKFRKLKMIVFIFFYIFPLLRTLSHGNHVSHQIITS